MKFDFKDKNQIRKYIWDKLVELGLAKFPTPPHGRIPNFIGVEDSAIKIINLSIFRNAKVIKVSPDSPQRLIREAALRHNKILIMPTPRIREGFLLLNPRRLSCSYSAASTIRGAFKYCSKVHPEELPELDLIVTGSVAVTESGRRIGKGGGYSELEYGILREYNKVSENTPIATNVHDIQIVNWLPKDPYDITVDYIATPTRLIKVVNREKRPPGILWEYLKTEKINEIPILMEMYSRIKQNAKF